MFPAPANYDENWSNIGDPYIDPSHVPSTLPDNATDIAETISAARYDNLAPTPYSSYLSTEDANVIVPHQSWPHGCRPTLSFDPNVSRVPSRNQSSNLALDAPPSSLYPNSTANPQNPEVGSHGRGYQSWLLANSTVCSRATTRRSES
jgi:hypothetical protein